MKSAVLLAVLAARTGALQVGVGIYDITGPSTDYVMMGMANPSQKGTGLHFRQRARAFVFVGDGGSRAAFVSVDSAMVGHVLKKKVLAKVGLAKPAVAAESRPGRWWGCCASAFRR